MVKPYILEQIASVEEMAERWGVVDRKVRRWCESNKVYARKIGREWVILKEQDVPTNEPPAIKITGIKKAVGEFNNWQGAARVYFDRSDLSVWTNVYASENEWNEYHDDNIVEIHAKLAMDQRDDVTSMKEIRELCEMQLNTASKNKFDGLDADIADLLKEIDEKVFYTVKILVNYEEIFVDVTSEMATSDLKLIDILEKGGLDKEKIDSPLVRIVGKDIYGFKDFEMNFSDSQPYRLEEEKHKSSYINAKYKDGKRYSLVCKVNLYSTMDEVFKKIQSHAGEVAHYLELSDDEQW